MQNKTISEHSIQNTLNSKYAKVTGYNDFFNFMRSLNLTNWLLEERSRKHGKLLYIVINGTIHRVKLVKYWRELIPEQLIEKLKSLGAFGDNTKVTENQEDLSDI